MENKITNIKSRVLQIPEYYGVSKEKFFSDIGMTYGNFKGKSKETPLNSNAIADILSIYPDINPDWLLTGRGSMLRGGIDSDAVKPRIMEFADAYYVSRTQFFSELGISEQSFLDASTQVNSTILSNIAQMNNQLNRDWLMTGKGPMMHGEPEELTHNTEKVIDNREEANALKDERIRSLEREVELLREMVDILKQSRGNSDQLGGEIKRVG